jgi:hypothetical protein
MNIPEKLKSRKLWIAVVSSAAAFLIGYLNDGHLSIEEIKTALMPLLAYIGVQGVVDAVQTYWQ